jgi:hypothetical protein
MCGACAPIAAPGGACSPTTTACPDGQDCSNDICVDTQPYPPPAPAAAGEQCDWYSICPQGYACISDSPAGVRRCAVPPAAGAPCASSRSPNSRCADGLYCTPASTCAPLPDIGQPCTTVCPASGYCDAGTCHLRGDVGSVCATFRDLMQGSCMAGLTCFCGSYICSSGTCMERRDEGAACGDSRGRCVPGSECVNGRCVANDALTRFTAACGP